MSFNWGNSLSAHCISANKMAMAMALLIRPLTTALAVIGREMKLRVAPTICIVLMRKRLLNMARRIVLSILTITITQRRIETTRNITPNWDARWFMLFTSIFGYCRSVTWSP